ncbi:MAG: flagellar biosynthetic protein FliR [Hyphomicrobiales bacterium]|nr:flagellar biosynthetic protein FliR [Hyphomicrobiales bacterium]MCP5373592.1 flagellar biosynthetic protein FliR [Hyphomicrobiales bacterium]
MLQELLNTNVYGFLVVFTRLGTAMALMPGFSAAYVPVLARLTLGLALSLLVLPVVADRLPPLPDSGIQLFMVLLVEFTAGAFIGTATRILIGALQTAGTMISYFSSMANAFVQDPVAEQQSSTIAGFLSVTGLLLIFVTDMHHTMLRAAVDSYVLFVPGHLLPVGDMADSVARLTADSFALGVRMSAPFVVTAVAYYLGLGLLGRLMPALPVFFFGLPVQITLQIMVLGLTLSAMMMAFLTAFGDKIGQFLTP